MNLLITITDKFAGLPLWAWIIIAAVVLIAIIIIAVVAAKIARAKKQNASDDAEEEEDGFSSIADDATPVEENVPAEPVKAQTEEKPAEKPAAKAEPAKSQPSKTEPVRAKQTQTAEKPAEKAQTAKSQPAKAAPANAAPAAQAEQAELEAIAKTTGPKVYHITKRMSDGKWQIKFNRGKKAIKLFDTQMQAIDYAKALAQNQEASIMIHKEDGSFRKLRYDKPNK